MQIKTKAIGEPLTLVEGKFFRVHTITRFSSVNVDDHELVYMNEPISYGLAIEKKHNKNNYYVVAFVKPNSNNEIVFEDVAFRSIDILDTTDMSLIEEYKNCVKFAKQAILDVLEKE